jgi:hypothetical protein
MITIEPQFDLERWHDDSMPTRSATPDVGDHRRLSVKTGGRTSAELANAQDPFDDDAFALDESDRDEEKRDQARSTRAVRSEHEQSQKEEKVYHVFSQRQKWFLIVIIGVAGMFSGLSSNIYFPSLNTIARASHLTLYN